MQRLFRLSFLVLMIAMLTYGESIAQRVFVSGRIDPGNVRIFVKDSTYILNRDYHVYGTLIIEPGTDVKFNPDGRMIVRAGGRVIADGLAETDYNPNPDGIDPIGTPGGSTNPMGFAGYSDLDYFLYDGSDRTIDINTERDLTVHPDKYDYIFNVILDKENRRVIDLDFPGTPGYPSDESMNIISFEEALMFKAARLEIDPDDDVNLVINPWRRLGGNDIEIEQETIRFIGQPVDNFSREWGHIIVLPGARAAFFRNVVFENFVKDTTVDRKNLYSVIDLPELSAAEVQALNLNLNMLTNGGGGAMTTFSSRTWLLGCEFNKNKALLRGGALQILEAPNGFPMADLDLGSYDIDKNPNITNPDGSNSDILRDNPIPMIDMVDEPGMMEPISDYDRQALDDGRLAVYLGRMRNLKFDQNLVELTNVIFEQIGNLRIVRRDYDNPANYPQRPQFPGFYGDATLGGAIFISGTEGSEYRQIEIGFGLNNSIKIDGEYVSFDEEDTFEATGNSADNYQNAASTYGARGGAIYCGRYTSLIATGEFSHNETYTKFLQDEDSGTNSGYFSMGGAIFCENTLGRLQVRGGPDRELIGNQTVFYQNVSGAGGAIYVDGNTDPRISPTIGGSDLTVATRDYGFGILFEENSAITWGGAVLSKRNMRVTGAGGVVADELIGYGGNYPVRFLNNTAGYAGGGLMVDIPNAEPPLPAYQRAIQIVRAQFVDNVVGEGIADLNKPEIRGGGAVYSLNGDLNVVKGVEFRGNKVYNGNGGAICLVHPETSAKRYFLTDLDEVMYDGDGLAYDYMSTNEVFTFDDPGYPADGRMLTRFLDNTIEVDQEILDSQSGSGTTQVGLGTLATTAALYGTTWLNTTEGFAVGYNGEIIRFTQGGYKWNYQLSGTGFRLNDIYFTSSSIGFAGGDRGVMLKTEDGGNNWNMITVPVDREINDITFVGSNIGFAVCDAGYILMTNNGGASWSVSQPQTSNLYSIFFTSTSVGYIVGERGRILKTTDGGGSWEVQLAVTQVDLNNVFFINTSTGYISGDAGTILKSTDGGENWVRMTTGVSTDLLSCYFTDVDNGFAVGNFGTFMYTNDGGDSWSEIDPGTPNTLYDIYFPSSMVGYVVGDYGLLMGTTDGGVTWTNIRPADESVVDINRLHQEIRLPENGVGLGGALYILDSVTVNRLGRTDSIKFNRVRIENCEAYTGAAIYSDNFDLKLIFTRSLIAGNMAYSEVGMEQNAIFGPIVRDEQTNDIAFNHASHDLAGAIIYGEVQGPLPYHIFSEASNSIFDNDARFLIRLPDAPNTKGVLAGTTGIGFGGTDTLRGNYWGRTEADVHMVIEHDQDQYDDAIFETFFVDTDGETHLRYLFTPDAGDPRTQGPFESIGVYSYVPVPLRNVAGDENTPDPMSIPEKLLQSGIVYDIYDKGTDIKTADYSARRMSPIEDFAVGVPPLISRFQDTTYPSFEKYIKRWTRDPFIAEAKDSSGNLRFPVINALQDEFRMDKNGDYYHPIGYPLFLETSVDYVGNVERSNHDPRIANESVFFVINETTGDFIRVNLKQVGEDAPYREVFRTRVELVPDSSNRTPNTLHRRTAEGLLNLGTGNFLLQQLARDPYKEDRATLLGRRYHNDDTRMGKVPDLYSNRPTMPPSNNGTAAYYAGERFSALPVDTGDVVRVISRTVLWKDGPIDAYNDGIAFRIIRSTEPPIFTGNVVSLRTDTITKIVASDYPWKDKDTIQLTEYLHTIFVSEDRQYPQREGTYSSDNIELRYRGRDSIATITAVDTNSYFDPRALMDPTSYPYLTYEWDVAPESGLKRWLMVDTVPAEDDVFDAQLPRDDAYGYLMFRGIPINPYIVPGGETVTVTAANYPPHYRTLDSLKKYNVADEIIANFINLFPPYFHAAAYDTSNARFAQQDTIDLGTRYKTEPYTFRIFVVDSTPRFLDPGSSTDVLQVRMSRDPNDLEDYVTYEPSEFACGPNDDGMLVANLTDKLRFKANFNTDDEMEDIAAVEWDNKFNRNPWNFRYGKTAYGFMNIALRRDDTTVIDSTIYDLDMDGLEDDIVITQTRPIWMANDYLHEYGNGQVDPNPDEFGVFYTTYGELDIRIDKDEAIQLLTPQTQYNGALNLDTVFTCVVNDGHGGVNFQTWPVYINIAPVITTEDLPAAKEDTDYNVQLLDSARMIKVFDPNFDQTHTFELVYSDDPRNDVPKDPCFPEAGVWDISTMKTTPDWLEINPENGLLYGTPRVKDAPRDEMITVIVTDEDGLTHVKQIPLRVDSTNHDPDILSTPITRCVDKGTAYVDTLIIKDIDLRRGREQGDPTETLTITLLDKDDNVIDPSVLSVDPSTITGILADDEVVIVISSASFDLEPDPDGKVTIKVRIVDAYGAEIIKVYRLKFSEETDFVCPVTVTNNNGAYEVLTFGTAPRNATTGEGYDAEPVGTLDSNFCEYELPPLPPQDVFDARWIITSTNGTIRNIFPQAQTGVEEFRIYKAKFQPGGENGETSPSYPMLITWNKTNVPARDDVDRNPSGGTWYLRDDASPGNFWNINMHTGETTVMTGVARFTVNGDECQLEILSNAYTGFFIYYDWASPVQEPIAGLPNEVSIVNIAPNPYSGGTATIQFGLPNEGRAKLEVIDPLGNVVKVLADQVFAPKFHVMTWDGRDVNGNVLPSGSYTCRLSAGGVTSAYPMVIIK